MYAYAVYGYCQINTLTTIHNNVDVLLTGRCEQRELIVFTFSSFTIAMRRQKQGAKKIVRKTIYPMYVLAKSGMLANQLFYSDDLSKD